MTAINHALTGTVIGLTVREPLLAIPLALASHFVCDALPHFSSSQPKEKVLKTNVFRNYLVAEAGLCFLLVVILALLHPHNWMLAAICAFTAASPDLLSINMYLKLRNGKPYKPGLYTRFALGIQWFARPIGGLVEAAWFVAGVIIITPFLS